MSLSLGFRLLFALFFVALFAYVLWEARFGFGARFGRAALFPLVIGIPGLALALATLALELRKPTQQATTDLSALEQGPPLEPAVVRRRTLAIGGWVVAFFLAIWLLGFSLAVPVATFLYLKVGAQEKWPITIILTVLSYAFFYGLFDRGLHVPFPEGLLLQALGGLFGA